MKKKWIVTIIAMCLTFVMMGALSACSGEQGPKGEKGEQGIQGIQGEPGKDGVTPTIEISDDGYWVINGDKTQYKAVGEDGTNGNDGATPIITISADGYWTINGDKTQYKAIGKDGSNGNNGKDGRGIVSVAYDKDGNLVINYTDNTSEIITLPAKEEYVHSYGEWIRYSQDSTDCEKVFFYRVCSDCNAVEWKIGSKEDHVWKTTYSYDAAYHWFACENCNKRQATEKHNLDANGNCIVCKQFIGGVHYELSPDGKSATVTYYDGIASTVYIEEEYQGVPVTSIGDSAFMDNRDIRMVVLPNTITTIEDFAFSLSFLDYIELPESVKTIGEYVFWDCRNLHRFEISKNVETIGAYAFDGTINLQLSVDSNNQYFKYEENVLYSKDGTVLYWYNDCDSLRASFVIPNTVKTIGTSAFVNCRYLHKLTISSSVIEIKAKAFNYNNISDYPNEIIFEETSGWVCTPLEEVGGDARELEASYLEDAALVAISNYQAYNWNRK